MSNFDLFPPRTLDVIHATVVSDANYLEMLPPFLGTEARRRRLCETHFGYGSEESVAGNHPVHLLNSVVIPVDGDFTVYGGPLTAAQAAEILNTRASAGLVSHVGHQSTAEIMSAHLGQAIPMSRTPWNGEGLALVCQLKMRPEEGRIYDKAEMAAFEEKGLIIWRWMVIQRQ